MSKHNKVSISIEEHMANKDTEDWKRRKKVTGHLYANSTPYKIIHLLNSNN